MTKNTFHEQQFFNALRDIFVGAEIEGDSGFINLMQIKSRYYQQGVFPKLKKDIDQAVADFPEFREELFDKLYTFFQRYFSESGSIYFRYTPCTRTSTRKFIPMIGMWSCSGRPTCSTTSRLTVSLRA